MDDNITSSIVLIIPFAIIGSLICLILSLIFRNRQFGKYMRTIALIVTFISFILSLGLVFLLLAHPYMYYALIAAGFSFLALVIIYFLKPSNPVS